MATIASPRDHSTTPIRRIPISTPTSSTRPSLDTTRSTVTSPAPPAQQHTSKRANRAALREYYNLRAPRIELPDSEVPPSDLDAQDFDADEYVGKVVAQSSLEELLRLYTRVVVEVRALDAEKKALVYDNYSKLITATETIRKLRTNMDPLNPMASTLDPAIAQIYNQASSIREALRQAIPSPDSDEGRRREAEVRKRKTQELAVKVLGTPERLRSLVKEGRTEDAKKQWVLPRRLLQSWAEQGVGGDDVLACIEEGDEVVGGEPQGLGLVKRESR
ncbi:Vps51/Vps67-domain-containing protein [Stachybotrys elegans]|uniref:Vacuolar protein sorting-associated protein 51 homolog n=1 Tax=Stachybotrys elegans TaxID=80388 RepID=A0A8K0WUB4_9HYPO|nr:Vps51/Vps67-domain-containing protein [Stachybotrys elegans]